MAPVATAELRGSRPFPPRVGVPSQRSDVTSRSIHGCRQVKAVGPASCVSKRCQPLRRALEESIGPHLIAACGVGDGDTDLGKSLPEVALLDRPGLPTRLQYFVSSKGTAGLHEGSSRLERLFRGKGLLRHG